MEAKKLQKRAILEILNKYKTNVELNTYSRNIYLCLGLNSLISEKLDIPYEKGLGEKHIPLFTHANAVIHANANPLKEDGSIPCVWFDVNDTITNNTNRIIFLDWLIEQYSKK